MLGVSVDQVNLFGVNVMELLLVHFICHDLVVGLVDVALLPDGDGRCVKKVLEREGCGKAVSESDATTK